jgi:ankyrin repeat protein
MCTAPQQTVPAEAAVCLSSTFKRRARPLNHPSAWACLVCRFINAGDNSYSRTPLHFACWSGQLEGTKELLASGASMFAQTTAHCSEPDMACNMGSTPLHLAALRGHQGIMVGTSHAVKLCEIQQKLLFCCGCGAVTLVCQVADTSAEFPRPLVERFRQAACIPCM